MLDIVEAWEGCSADLSKLCLTEEKVLDVLENFHELFLPIVIKIDDIKASQNPALNAFEKTSKLLDKDFRSAVQRGNAEKALFIENIRERAASYLSFV